jgi:hypothetical protein
MQGERTKIESVYLECKVMPDEGRLWAQGRLALAGVRKSIPLLMNHHLTWRLAQVSIGDEWKKVDMIERPLPEDSFLHSARLWELQVPEGLEGTRAEVRVAYAGTIGEPGYGLNQISPTFVELAVYGGWYPVLPWLPRHTFKLRLTAPEGWSWIANGLPIARGGPVWMWESTAPDLDITLLGMPEAELGESVSGALWGPRAWLEKVSHIEREYLEAERTLVNWLCSVPRRPVIAYAHRDSGGWYLRNGLIVTQGEGENTLVSRDTRSAMQGILHEVMHFWFGKTSIETYDNWLDEALAEYVSCLVLRDLYGDEWFEQQIAGMRSQLEGEGELPAIRSVIRSQEGAEPLYYKRGALLFHEIRRGMGVEDFKDWVATFAERCLDSDKVTTDDLADSLQRGDLRLVLAHWLDYIGVGVPNHQAGTG